MKMISKMGFALLALLLGSTGWGQTSFGKYGPVAGVQMNTGATPYNFAAGITDIQSLLSASPGVVLGGATGGAKGVGSINATALFINGAAVGTSSGAVSSVALGSPGTCFGVTGSPVTSAGTLAYTLSGASTGLLRADGSCSNTPVIIAAPSSGTTLTATGVAGGAAGQFTGSGSGDEFFRFNNTAGDTRVTWSSAGTKYGIIQAFTNGFNFAANGASTALDLSVNNGIAVQIQPAGNVAVNVPASGSALTVNGAAGVGVYASRINGSTTASQSFGHLILAGTNAADAALVVNNAANTLTFLDIAGDGSGTLGAKLSWTVGGNVAINAPSSGVAFSATGIANQYAGLFTAGGSAGTQKGLSAVSTTQNAADKILNVNNSVSNLLDIFGDGHGDLGPNLSWTVAGNWSAAAPTSGNTLSIANLVGARGLSVTSPGATNSLSASWAVDFGGAWNLFTQSDSFALGTTGASSLILATASSNRINISGTGNVAVSAPSSGVALGVAGSANSNAMTVTSPNTTSQSFGILVSAGTNASDRSFLAQSAAGTNYLNVLGDGGVVIGSPTGGDKGLGSLNAQALYVNGVAVGGGAAAPIVCTAACNVSGIAVGQYAIVSRILSGSSSVASSTTSTADPVLQFTSAPAGLYELRYYSEYSSGGAGFRFRITSPGNDTYISGVAGCTTAQPYFAPPLSDVQCTSTNGMATGSTFVRTNGAGTISFDWAQSTSSGTATLLFFESDMILTRLN